MIVDDNNGFADLASGLLAADGFEVVGMAPDSARALRLMADVRPDVALIDLYLGRDNGIDLIADIAGSGLARQTFMILVSSCDVEDLRAIYGTSAADGYLPKMELSAAAIRGILHGRGNGHGKRAWPCARS